MALLSLPLSLSLSLSLLIIPKQCENEYVLVPIMALLCCVANASLMHVTKIH